MTQAQRDIARQLKVLNHAKQSGNISQTCRYFGISRESFYKWKRAYEKYGEQALINSKPCPENPNCEPRQKLKRKSSTCAAHIISGNCALPGICHAITASKSLPAGSIMSSSDIV